MAVNVAEFISVLRKIRDVIYPEVNTLYENAVDLNTTINANKTDFDASIEQFNQDYEIFNQDIVEINDLVVSAQASSTSASQSAQIATNKSNEIKEVTAQSTTLSPGSQATASYNPVDGKITIGVPSGLKGDKGDSFTVNAVGVTSDRTIYNSQPTGFSFLDITLALIYFKLSSTSGNWSTGAPFGKGDKGDDGDSGNGILGIAFLSTTHASGLSGQSGSTDTYRITYTNATTFDFIVHNGSDIALSSNNPLVAGTANAGTSSQGSKSDHIHPAQTSVSGNAGTATKLANTRTIALAGDATGELEFDGSSDIHANISIPTLNKLLHVIDEKVYRDTGGSFFNGAWRTRTLNKIIVNDIDGATLASNIITLPIGRYYIEASAPAYMVNNHRAKIVATGGQTIELKGTSEWSYASVTTSQTNRSYVTGILEATETKSLTLKHICSTTSSPHGFGEPSLVGDMSEIYSEVKIWKIG